MADQDEYIHSEADLLALVDAFFPNTPAPGVIRGRGDDCAELSLSGEIALSTDLFLEDAHFRRRYFTPEEIGHKALAVNLSDLAAAGARPLGFSLGLMTPTPLRRDYARRLFRGMAELAGRYALPLTGGDISRADSLGVCITIWGRLAAQRFLRRGPVRPGDVLFLYGIPGLARVGLSVLENEGREALARYPAACAAHLRPEPLLATGQALASLPGICLMDLSDGLARDLPRLLGHNGAAIVLEPSALHAEVTAYARAAGADPVSLAFAGGEEYGLLGACPEAIWSRLTEIPQEAPLLRLGCVGGANITLNGREPVAAGFDHFSGATP